MKVAISLPDELHARAEQAAQRLGRTRSGLYAEALAAYLDAVDGVVDDVTAALDAAYVDDVRAPRAGAAAGRALVDAGAWEW